MTPVIPGAAFWGLGFKGLRPAGWLNEPAGIGAEIWPFNSDRGRLDVVLIHPRAGGKRLLRRRVGSIRVLFEQHERQASVTVMRRRSAKPYLRAWTH